MDKEEKEVKKKKTYEKPSYEMDEIIEKMSLACPVPGPWGCKYYCIPS